MSRRGACTNIKAHVHTEPPPDTRMQMFVQFAFCSGKSAEKAILAGAHEQVENFVICGVRQRTSWSRGGIWPDYGKREDEGLG